MHRVVVATCNDAKLLEISANLGELDIDPISLKSCVALGLCCEVPIVLEHNADQGATFESNALKKAREVCDLLGLPTLADDSGLEIDYLGGLPGVDSAYYLGDDTPYSVRLAHILEQMKDVGEGAGRTARFVSVIALALPDGTSYITRGEYTGMISQEIRGNNGFGYDSIFISPDHDKTFAELTSEQKYALSHRAIALKKMGEVLRACIQYSKSTKNHP